MVEFRLNTPENVLAPGEDSEESQTDSGNRECPGSNKNMLVDEEEGEELSNEDGSNRSEFLKVPFLDYDLEKRPPVIYTKG